MQKIKDVLQGIDRQEIDASLPLVSIVASALNEESILENRLNSLYDYLKTLKDRYNFEVILINDGSKDRTGAIMEKFAAEHGRTLILHHRQNLGLGRSLQDAFSLTHGKYVVTTDIDLSCPLYHIELLLNKIMSTDATIVIASPTMEGGRMLNVPPLRKFLSKMANGLLSSLTTKDISNFTHMMRVYKGDFIRSTNLRSNGMEVMPEVIYKAIIRGEKIEQIPAVLDWGVESKKTGRQSKMRVLHHTLATLMTSFILHPFFYFIFPGLLIFFFSLYPLGWMFAHFIEAYNQVGADSSFLDHASHAFALAYATSPHTFFMGLFSLLLALQLIALGFLSLQNKHYYEETFDMLSKISKKMAERP